jgi:hypothetical protein
VLLTVNRREVDSEDLVRQCTLISRKNWMIAVHNCRPRETTVKVTRRCMTTLMMVVIAVKENKLSSTLLKWVLLAGEGKVL